MNIENALFAMLFSLNICLMLFCIGMLFRNEAVANFRRALLQMTTDACRYDIKQNSPWEWRYAEFEKVGYDDMMCKFWRPLRPEHWYADCSFLKRPNAEGKV